jgi:hypothetical protein
MPEKGLQLLSSRARSMSSEECSDCAQGFQPDMLM